MLNIFRDHAGGNEKLAAAFPGVPVIGGDQRIPALTRTVQHGDTFKVNGYSLKIC